MLVVGRPGPALAALRPGVEGDQPGPHHQRRRSRSSPAATPSAGVFAYPERLGYWPAALGLFAFVWLELVYPHSHRARPGAAVVRGVRRGDAGRRRAVRQHVLRARRPVRGLLDPGRRGCRSGAGATAGCVVRSPLANLDTTAGPARPGRRWSSVLFGSTAFDSFKDSTPLGAVRPGHRRRRRTCSTTSRCSPSALGVGADLRGRHDATGVGPGTRRRRAAQPVRALDRADHRRLHRRPLPDLPGRGRPADADPGQRPVQQRQQPVRHRATWSVNYWLSYHPTAAGHHQGARGRARPRARRDRRPRPGDHRCCPRSTSSPASCRCCSR